jgi:hypothetical protein
MGEKQKIKLELEEGRGKLEVGRRKLEDRSLKLKVEC